MENNNEQCIGHPGLPGQNADAAVEERDKKYSLFVGTLSEWPILYTKAPFIVHPSRCKNRIISSSLAASQTHSGKKLLHGAPFPDQTFTPHRPRAW